MRILVLCNAFEFPNYNARLRAQCDWLVKHKHQVDVYTETGDTLDFEHDYKIYEVGECNQNTFKWWLQSIYSVLTNYKERKFAYQVLWQLRWKQYDVLYCSTKSCFPLCAAVMIAKVKRLKLHVDLSDVLELNPSYVTETWWHPWRALRQKLYRYRRQQALKQVASVTTVSESHVDFLKNLHPNVSLLYHGFNAKQCYYAPVKNNLFRINYIGYAYESQNFDMLMHIFTQFKNELPKAQWNFYSTTLTYNHFKYSQPNICGLLPQQIIGDTLRQSSLILMMNDTDDNELQSDQFYQALGAEKPILFAGANKGPIPDLINLTHAGLASRSVKESMEFIRQLYQEWEQNGYTHQEVINKDLFNSQFLGQQLEQHLMQLV